MKSPANDWDTASGDWIFTQHAQERLRNRFNLTSAEMDEVLENLRVENFVKVPERRPRPGVYTIQTVIGKGSLFLAVGIGSKRIVTALVPFCQFPEQLPGEPIVGMDTYRNEEDADIARIQEEIAHPALLQDELPRGIIKTVKVVYMRDNSTQVYDSLEDAKEAKAREEINYALQDETMSAELRRRVYDTLIRNAGILAKILNEYLK